MALNGLLVELNLFLHMCKSIYFFRPPPGVSDLEAYKPGKRNCTKNGMYNSIKYSHLCFIKTMK